jgi:thiol-disulfide isomerase/thioredoxin
MKPVFTSLLTALLISFEGANICLGEPVNVPIVNQAVLAPDGSWPIRNQIVLGKWTIVQFGSPTCPPCPKTASALVAFSKKYSDYHFLYVEVPQRDKTLREQFDFEYAPQFRIYAPNGKLHSTREQAWTWIQNTLDEKDFDDQGHFKR